jgi:hypothetical protein
MRQDREQLMGAALVVTLVLVQACGWTFFGYILGVASASRQ